MSKLENYLLEKRNIEGDIGRVKRIVKGYVKKRTDLRVKMLNDVDRIIDSVSKSTDKEDNDVFIDQIISWINDIEDEIREPDLETAFK